MRSLTALFFTLSLLAAVGGPVLAVEPKSDYGIGATAKQAALPDEIAGSKTVPGIVGRVVAIVLSLMGIVFFLLILYAGLSWMIARGNTEKIDAAKDVLEGAVIGLILIMAAYAIATFVFSALDKGVA